MNRDRTIRRALLGSVCTLLGLSLSGACAENEGEMLSVSYQPYPSPLDASALNEARDPSAGSDLPFATQGPAAPPAAAPTCDLTFCPTSAFGPACCLPTGGCGVSLIGICIPAPQDAGAPATPTTAPTTPPPPEDAGGSTSAPQDAGGTSAPKDAGGGASAPKDGSP